MRVRSTPPPTDIYLPRKSFQSHKEKVVWFPSKRDSHSSHPQSYSIWNMHKIHNSKIPGSHEIFEVQSLLHTIYKPSSLAPGQHKDLISFHVRGASGKGEVFKPGRIFSGKMLHNTLTLARCSQMLHLLSAADLQFLCSYYGIDTNYSEVIRSYRYCQEKCIAPLKIFMNISPSNLRMLEKNLSPLVIYTHTYIFSFLLSEPQGSF